MVIAFAFADNVCVCGRIETRLYLSWSTVTMNNEQWNLFPICTNNNNIIISYKYVWLFMLLLKLFPYLIAFKIVRNHNTCTNWRKLNSYSLLSSYSFPWMIKNIKKLIVGCSRCVQMRKKQRWYGRRYTSAYKLCTCTTIILGNIHCEKNWDISMQCQMYFFVSCCIWQTFTYLHCIRCIWHCHNVHILHICVGM